MGICFGQEETPAPVEMNPATPADPLEELKKLIAAKRQELNAAAAALELTNPQVRYLTSTVNKIKQCSQELTTKFEDEVELHKGVEYHIAEQDAMDIRKATYGIGTDEKKLASVIVSRLANQIALIDQIYQKDYDMTLEKVVNKEGRSLTGLVTGGLSDFGKFISYRVMQQGRRDALLLRKCMSGMGCADKPLVEILSTRTNAELKAAAAAYKEAFDEDMVERISKETGGMLSKHYGNWIDCLVGFDRDETENVPSNVDQLAERLYKAGKGKFGGCDEEVFQEILCKANEPTIKAIREAYSRYQGKGYDLVEHVASEMSGDLEFSVLARVRGKLDFLCKRLFGSCKGLGTDEEIIARVLGCLTNSEVADLVKRYEVIYKDEKAPFNSFRALMVSELSGDFLDAILQCLDNPSPKGHWTVKDLYAPNATKSATEFKAKVQAAYVVDGAVQLGRSALDGSVELVGVDKSTYFLCPNIDDPYPASGPLPEVVLDRERLINSAITDLESGNVLLNEINAKIAEFTNRTQINQTVITACTPDYFDGASNMRYLDSQARQLMDDNANMIDFSLERSVTIVAEACKGWGADEMRLIKVLCSLSKEQLAKVDKLYEQRFGKTLKKEMDGELSAFFGSSKHFADFMDVVLTPPAEYDAKLLQDSMKGWGTDESLLSEVCCTRTNLELMAAKKFFEAKHKKTVEQWVKDDTSGFYSRFLLRCLQCDRKEVQVDAALAAQQAQALKAGFEDANFKEDVVFDILCTASPAQLDLIKNAYQSQGGDLMKTIVDKLDGDCEKAVLLRCTPKHVYYAKVLHKAWKGMGTDENATSRVFGRSTKADLRKIAEAYTNITGVDFKSAIEDETSGFYQKALKTYVFNDPPPVKKEEEAPPPS